LSFREGPGKASTIVNITDVVVTNSTADEIGATLSDGATHTLSLTITKSAGNWMVKQMTFDGVPLHMRHSISANMGFSYHCSRGAEFPRPDFTQYVTIGWQIQPNFVANTELKAFGEPFDCVGFTSAGIWGGLFVTFLLILILTYGISWMLDIKTMDRFDDPKGKTIIVSATD
jgi:V-type H+-transporting ATPase S1 subunit